MLKDPRNANQLVQADVNSNNDANAQGELVLSLSLSRAPRRGSDFIIGRHRDADIVLTDPVSSTRHCIISINDKGVPSLRDQSTNGTLINGKICSNQIFEVRSGMQIEIGDATFDIRVPWRGTLQEDYEYKA